MKSGTFLRKIVIQKKEDKSKLKRKEKRINDRSLKWTLQED